MRVAFHKRARIELEEAVSFYSSASSGIGSALRDEVAEALGRIIDHPAIGVQVRTPLRRYVLNRFPYSLIDGVAEDQILVLAVMHHKRRPGYWHGRV